MEKATTDAPDLSLRLSVFQGRLAVCRLEPGAGIPAWVSKGGFFSVTRTPEELSVVCPQDDVPPGVESEANWLALKLEGPFEFTQVGVLASVTVPLAEAGVGVFAISTFDTDYVLVKEERLESAVAALRAHGHEVP